jgi:hypothetical protein
MIVTANMSINGKAFVKTYSNSGYMIERDGIRYSEAIDPEELNHKYTETDELIEGYTEEATDEDYQAALREMGVEV